MFKTLRMVHKLYHIKTCTALRWLECGAIQKDVNRRIRILERELCDKQQELSDLKLLRSYMKTWPR
jgi:hypothetical protein